MSSINKSLLDSGNFFKRICEALEIDEGFGSQSKIAEIVGITKSSIGNWRDGGMPGKDSLHNVDRVSELSGVSLHWLLTGEGEKYVSTVRKVNLDESFREVIREIIREELQMMMESVVEDGVSLEKADMIIARSLGRLHDEKAENKKQKRKYK